MEITKIKFLYGIEFWDTLFELLSKARERVFLISAFIGEKDYTACIEKIPKDVFTLTMCRSDNQNGKYFPPNAFIVNSNNFHGKIYLIDNTLIIGSQNLYRAKEVKEGEFSVMITTDPFSSSLLLYQALIKIMQKEGTPAEPVSENFLSFYDNGCPFCGNSDIPDPYSLIKCPGYGFDFVSEDDCDGYAGEGACQYCFPENREYLGECYCCDDSGCGFGISIDDLKLIHHAINPISEEDFNKAKFYLSLFNFFEDHGENAVEIFQKLGFTGKVYFTTQKREEIELINIEKIRHLIKL
ncbi:hypothetical protein SDC9_102330 [bioreactor metagenome]|uniref:PLD phosphodiesterase domain-containing protein n=1 Tax=bioreactor metagenome TaxID=1076179 RepID=A0A645AX96_9ZZZZ